MPVECGLVRQQASPSGFRTFLVLWGTQSVSILGDFVTAFGITIWLTRDRYPAADQRPQLAFALAALTIGSAVVALVGSPLFGVWVDRHDRRRTMAAMDLTNGILSGLLAILVATGTLRLGPLLAIMWLAAGVSELHSISFEASYVLIVPEQRLPRANGMMQATRSVGQVVAAPVTVGLIGLAGLADGGWLLDRWNGTLGRGDGGIALVFMVDALSFFLAAASLVAVRIPALSRGEEADEGLGAGVWAEAWQGVQFLRQRRPLLLLLSFFTVGNLAASAALVLLPLVVKIRLAGDWLPRGWSFEEALAVVTTAGGAGAILGGLAISLWGGLGARRIYGVVVPLVVASFLQIVAGVSNLLFLTAAVWSLNAFLLPTVRAHWQAIWQQHTPPALQGRVFAVRRLAAGATIPLGAAIAGWAGGRYDPGTVVAVLGAVAALVGVAQLLSPDLRRFEAEMHLLETASSTGTD